MNVEIKIVTYTSLTKRVSWKRILPTSIVKNTDKILYIRSQILKFRSLMYNQSIAQGSTSAIMVGLFKIVNTKFMFVYSTV